MIRRSEWCVVRTRPRCYGSICGRDSVAADEVKGKTELVKALLDLEVAMAIVKKVREHITCFRRRSEKT